MSVSGARRIRAISTATSAARGARISGNRFARTVYEANYSGSGQKNVFRSNFFTIDGRIIYFAARRGTRVV